MKQIFFGILLFGIHNIQGQYFTKITSGVMVNTPGDSRSVNWIDVNNDGFTDCFISNGPSGGQNNMLYINTGAGTFTANITDSIVLDNKPSDGATFGDTDNNGTMDAFVANWYNVDNLFYLNNGSGQFTGIHSQILSNDGGYSETAAWGDYDEDGLIDLYVTNSAGNKKNFLYHNDGNNTFTKILTGSPVTDAYNSRGVNWSDIDNDGDVDLFVTNEGVQHENIYRNDGGGVFTSLTSGPLLTNGGNTMSGSWGDYDNDGDMDVFLANDGGMNALFRNEGNFSFTKIINDTLVKTPARSFSSGWSDVDNDGDLDLFITNAFKPSGKLLNYFYINGGNGTFTRNSNDVITLDSAWSYGCAFGDYDNDGFEDLAVATCRFGGNDKPDFLYHNNTNSNNWITIKLTGSASNRAAIGARVWLKATISGQPVWQLREISSQNAYCSQNDIRAHFGLGNATIIDSVKIKWPSGISHYYTNVSINQFVEYNEATMVGISEIESGPQLKIYPNPAHGKCKVLLSGQEFVKGDKWTIINTVGKVQCEQTILLNSNFFEIDTDKYMLSSGIYFLTVETEGGRISSKFIVRDNF